MAALYLGSCATPYQRSGFTGGFEDQRTGPQQFFVSVRGNGYTGETTLVGYFHRRSQELCRSIGFTHYEHNSATKSLTSQLPSTYTAQTSYSSGSAVTTVQENPGMQVTKHTVSGYVTCHTPLPIVQAPVATPVADPLIAVPAPAPEFVSTQLTPATSAQPVVMREPSVETPSAFCRTLGLLLVLEAESLEQLVPGLGGAICRGAGRTCDGGTIGEAVCRIGGSSACSGVSIGEGICRAGGAIACSGASLGEGICRAGGAIACSGVAPGEGICRAGGAIACSGVSVGEGVCRAAGVISCSGVSLAEGLCRSANQIACTGVTVPALLCSLGEGPVTCSGRTLAQALCSAAGVACAALEIEHAIAAATAACGPERMFAFLKNRRRD